MSGCPDLLKGTMKTLSKKDVCALLGISPKTLQRRMAKGQYKFTRTGEGRFSEVAFTFADIGLPEPVEPTTAPDVPVSAPELEPTPALGPVIPERPLSNIELRTIEDAVFADHYKQGLVTDSAGNNVNGTNEKFPSGPITLLGPRQPEQKRKASGASHMDPKLVADPSVAHNPIDSDEFNELWHPGHKQRVQQMYADAGVRQPTEQENKSHVDRAAIMAAFRQGYSR